MTLETLKHFLQMEATIVLIVIFPLVTFGVLYLLYKLWKES